MNTSLQSKIEITPPRARVDQPVSIKLHGFKPGERITVQALMTDDQEKTWKSSAVFTADEKGEVDLYTADPLEGTYKEADPMGLFWSMDADPPGNYRFTMEPRDIVFTAQVNGEIRAKAVFTRYFIDPDVMMEDVRDDGLVGVFCRPPDPDPRPAVMILGGSGGGLVWARNMAALLSSYGIAALGLAYFNKDHLPPTLAEIPLEYFEKALSWMKNNRWIQADGIGILGHSRGGELAMLLASTFDSFKAAAAYAPSSVIIQSVTMKPVSPWTFRGEKLPFIELKGIESLLSKSGGKPVSLRECHLENLKDREAAERASIPVEKIKGPVLLISGDDDRIWPTDLFCREMIKKLDAAGHPYPHIHINYAGAGHSLAYPNTPATSDKFPVRMMGFDLAEGGTPRINAHGRADSHVKVIEFFRKSLM